MRLAFIADIHGNAVALESVLNDIQKKSVDKIYVLGDLCYRGPEPQRTLDLIRSLETEVIKGNADEWIVRGIKEGEVPEQVYQIMNVERNWAVSKLNEDSIAYLKGLPTNLNLEFGRVKIQAFHATPNSLFETVQPFDRDGIIQEKFFLQEADIYIFAHIHKSFIRYINGKSVINTGSVSLPFDGINTSSYLLIDIGENYLKTSIIRVEYDVNKVIQQLKELNYPNKKFIISALENSRV